MNGDTPAATDSLSVTLIEERWTNSVYEPLRHHAALSQETSDYLRERSVVENMTARRLFADDDC